LPVRTTFEQRLEVIVRDDQLDRASVEVEQEIPRTLARP
jgi:hypothetical protein